MTKGVLHPLEISLKEHSEEVHPDCRIFRERFIILYGMLFEMERSTRCFGSSFVPKDFSPSSSMDNIIL
jgi:hypothetical protein